MNTTLHNNPDQQAVYIDSINAPILERAQGFPGGLGQGQPPSKEEDPKEVRWSSHGVYYRTPEYENTMLWVTPETKKIQGEINSASCQRLMLCFVYVWCFWLIVIGIFYYTSMIERMTFFILIGVISLLLLVFYLRTKR